MGVFCQRCGYKENEAKIHYHHIIPKWMGGTDADGRFTLCDVCHYRFENAMKKIYQGFAEMFINFEYQRK